MKPATQETKQTETDLLAPVRSYGVKSSKKLSLRPTRSVIGSKSIRRTLIGTVLKTEKK
jgi:hypothetical protein